MRQIQQVTPFIFTHNLKAACAFYDSLGFKTDVFQPELGHAYCTDDHVALRLLELGEDHPIAEQMVYFDVADVDMLYETLKPVLDRLPEGRARAPFDQSYGQRELHIKDPDNCLLMFGTKISGS